MSMMEGLESRRMMSVVQVTDIVADNRGEATIRLSGPVTNINKRTVRIYTAGPDNIPNTDDDVLVPQYSVGYNQSANRVTIRAKLDANTKYRIRMQASQIVSVEHGTRLDGSFDGTFPTGDGISGGNLNFSVRKNGSTQPRLRMATSGGNIDVTLRGDLAGVKTTVDNFIRYANAGLLDQTIIHRKVRTQESGIGIVQGGGFYSSSSPFDSVDAFDPIPLQAGVLSNVAGTIAMARTTDPNSATSQFFFNATDNTALDTTGGGYAVFGAVSNASSLASVTAIYNATNINKGSPFNTLPQFNGEDVYVRRVAMLGRVEPL